MPASLALAVALFWLRARSWVYTMDHDAAIVQWGLIGHRRYGIPLSHIATLKLKQSPIDRVLGVGTVELIGRDQLGKEQVMVMEDLLHPRETYEEIMRLMARASQSNRRR
jgi:uncharacterized membrane protein YdbT with pleckstrin-like domain